MSNNTLEVFCWFLCVVCLGLFWAIIILGIILGGIISDIKKQIDDLSHERRNKND